ncbi:hypothetical protein Cgig2_021681 [Carnegiea gigantea]|uniref:Uncharacterized protein n=1 Tax=Carnegiea gigantea TaxID=171969 RepID=A0A9Q1QNY2_9CARY|nr:hypothetical protein Cgig2_021681 [Carnegiea gigantea]
MYSSGFCHRGQRRATSKGPFSSASLLRTIGCLASALGFTWHYAQPIAPHRPLHFPLSGVRCWRTQAGCSGQCQGKPRVVKDRHGMYQVKHSTSDESRRNRTKSGQKYEFIRFGDFYHGKSAIEVLNGETVKGHKLDVACVKFQNRASLRPRKQREEPQKKIVGKWIPKKKSHINT